MSKYFDILRFVYPDKKWAAFYGCSYDEIEWLDDSPKPSKEEFDAASIEAEDLRNLEIVRNNRSEAYSPKGDQLDAIWKFINQLRLDGTNLPEETIDELDKIVAVKNKYPKPEQKKT